MAQRRVQLICPQTRKLLIANRTVLDSHPWCPRVGDRSDLTIKLIWETFLNLIALFCAWILLAEGSGGQLIFFFSVMGLAGVGKCTVRPFSVRNFHHIQFLFSSLTLLPQNVVIQLATGCGLAQLMFDQFDASIHQAGTL
jgi:hypothetical protein